MLLRYWQSNYGVRSVKNLKKYCQCQRQIDKNKDICRFCKAKQKDSSQGMITSG